MIAIDNIFEVLSKNNPTPTTELVYTSDFELLIAVVLSAQATDIGVNKATNLLFKIANTPEQILNLGVTNLEKYIKTIGLYKTKAKHIIKLCEILITEFYSQIPDNLEDLITLPGVGRKTANVILNTLYHHPVVAVDTHVFRVSKRLGIANGNNVFEVEQELHQKIPIKYLKNAHHLLILHGRYVCKAKNPQCDICAIRIYCNASST